MRTRPEPSSAAEVAVRVEVYGTVQGVGFRPFVYRLATDLRLHGDVRNAGGHVVVRLVGHPGAVDEFLTRLTSESPSRSNVARIAVTEDTCPATNRFTITASADLPRPRDLPPDLATCGVRTVCLGGGVFQNALLVRELTAALASQGFEVHIGQRIPVNDGGVSYGQGVIAAATANEG